MAPALKMALDLAKDQDADLVMATDPDADRLGIAVPDGGEWKLISGNQLGSMLADYIFRTRKSQGRLPANPAFVNTIVTSEIQNRIAESYGATCFRVLTGFKYIGEKIRQFEADNTYSYVFGGEESYGFLVGTAVRDKDAVSAASMTAEMALWNRNRGKSVMDHLRELWARFGFWKEILISRDFEGQKGQEIMASLMESLREDPPQDIASVTIEAMRDFRNGTTTKIADGSVAKDIMLPSSDVLQFVLADGSLVTARPSGTEPKVKFYASCRSDLGSDPAAAEGELDGLFSGIENWVNQRIKAVGG
jgi:phosphoglucomutase